MLYSGESSHSQHAHCLSEPRCHGMQHLQQLMLFVACRGTLEHSLQQ